MGFEILTGTMGGGKSYLAAERAIKCFAEGGRVMSNFDFDFDELKRLGWEDQHIALDPDPQQWRHQIVGGEEGAENLFIVDEAAMTFHAWDIQESKKRDRELFDTLVMSRKLGLDTIFISQSAENVNSAIRRISQHMVRCVAVKKMPVIGGLLAKFKGDFLRIIKSPEKGAELSRSYHRFSLKVGSIYKTEALKGVALAVKRDVTRKLRKAEPIDWRLKLGAIACLAAFSWAGYSVYDTFAMVRGIKDKPKAVAGASSVATPGQLPASSGAAAAPPQPAYSGQWWEFPSTNERIISSVRMNRGALEVRTADGGIWPVGTFQGAWPVVSLRRVGAHFIAETDDGEKFLLRPLEPAERHQIYTQLATLKNQYQPAILQPLPKLIK